MIVDGKFNKLRLNLRKFICEYFNKNNPTRANDYLENFCKNNPELLYKEYYNGKEIYTNIISSKSILNNKHN